MVGQVAQDRLARRKAALEGALLRSLKGGHKNGARRMIYVCANCQKDLTGCGHIKCNECADMDLCVDCFCAGVEVFPHKCTHAFRIIDSLSVPIYDPTWGADEELLLLEAVDMYGPHSWDKISEHVGIKRAAECQRHYLAVYWEHDQAPLPVALPSMKDVDPTQGVVTAVVAQGGDIEPSSATRGTKSIMEDSEAEPEATTAARGPKGKKRSHPDEGLSSPAKGKRAKHAKQPAPGTQQPVHDELGITRTLRTAADYGPGSAQNTVEVTGFSWKRKEFDHEWDNEAEIPIAELDFEEGDTEETKKHKIELLHIYNKRIQERERRRAIILQRGLLDVKKMQGLEKRASADELILSAKLRPFARFCSSSEFRCLVLGMCAEHDIRVALSDLMDLRRNGITSLAEADQFRAERAKRESRRGDTRIKVAPDVAGLPQDRASRYAQRAGDTGLKQNIPMEAAPREVQRLLESSGLGPESRVPPLELLRAAKDGFLASQILPGMDALTEEECGLCSSLRILPCQLLAAKFVAPRVLARDGEVTRDNLRGVAGLDPLKAQKIADAFSSGQISLE